MTIEKAIEIGTNTLKANYKFLDPDFREFIKLGIEALKEVDALRKVLTGLGKSLLPGETEE